MKRERRYSCSDECGAKCRVSSVKCRVEVQKPIPKLEISKNSKLETRNSTFETSRIVPRSDRRPRSTASDSTDGFDPPADDAVTRNHHFRVAAACRREPAAKPRTGSDRREALLIAMNGCQHNDLTGRVSRRDEERDDHPRDRNHHQRARMGWLYSLATTRLRNLVRTSRRTH